MILWILEMHIQHKRNHMKKMQCDCNTVEHDLMLAEATFQLNLDDCGMHVTRSVKRD